MASDEWTRSSRADGASSQGDAPAKSWPLLRSSADDSRPRGILRIPMLVPGCGYLERGKSPGSKAYCSRILDTLFNMISFHVRKVLQ